MNKYIWQVTLMDTTPSSDGLTDVVVGVHWYAEASDGSQVNPVKSSITGYAQLGDPTPQDFTAYDQLSQATVLSWVWNIDDTRQVVQQKLDELIEEKKAPQTANLPLPWSPPIINSRADLDALKGTKEHADFIGYLKGSMTRKTDIAEYPDDYNREGYDGSEIEPIWVEVEDLSTITRFGFTPEELEDEE